MLDIAGRADKNCKTVTYAYSSSPMADKHNKGKACYLVYPSLDESPEVFQDTVDGKIAAFSRFDELPGEPDRYSMRGPEGG